MVRQRFDVGLHLFDAFAIYSSDFLCLVCQCCGRIIRFYVFVLLGQSAPG